MKVVLDKENRFLTNDGKVDLKQALKYSGIKAAWCYKKGTTTPENIREMSEENLIRMGIDTFLNDHGTPNEHYNVSVEIIGLPKLMCMILNDEHQYSTCERSLRYTKVLPSNYITSLEVELYDKWLKVFQEVLTQNYGSFFQKSNEQNPKKAEENIKKIAQENARQFVSILTPTSMAYTAPWYQWQKIGIFLKQMIEAPNTELEKLAVPYAKELIEQLLDLNIIVKTKDAIALYPPLSQKITQKREWLYQNNKGIILSLFAENNIFSGINKPNAFGSAINYNTKLSYSGVAQLLRHRTIDVEISAPSSYESFCPEFIKATPYFHEYMRDMLKVKELYPQGQIIPVNIVCSLKNVIQFVGQERACEKAQQEIENWYVTKFLPDIIDGLSTMPEYQEEYQLLKEKYLNKCRCAYPNYNCPNPCGHPRVRRPF